MKTLLVTCCSAIIAGAYLVGAPAATAADSKPRVAVIVMANNSEYWNTVARRC